ncbi:MAG: hypothetical protein KDA96_03490 [Planctomycetaceae bacterium]|nr:hypothetical protein [Planctomycetaceae bacterium]
MTGQTVGPVCQDIASGDRSRCLHGKAAFEPGFAVIVILPGHGSWPSSKNRQGRRLTAIILRYEAQNVLGLTGQRATETTRETRR